MIFGFLNRFFSFENEVKVYLIRTGVSSTFVTVIEKTNPLNRETLIILTFFLLALTGLPAQDTLVVWPGDVNNNGIVNGVDVLYWSAAQDERGPSRPMEDTLWAEQEVAAWEGAFPDGLNYAYADCDGNGIVNEADLRIITTNFNETREGSVPDLFINGIPEIDPPLKLEPRQAAVSKGETAEFDVSLGDEVVQTTDFFGITFTIPYDPEITNRNQQGALFELEQESWMGRLNADVKEFVFNDAEAGKTHIAIYRKKKEVVSSGEGQVGVYSIVVVEDIAVGIKSVDLGLEDVKMVDLELTDMPVVVDSASVAIDQSTSREEWLDEDHQLLIYPNPAFEEVAIEWADQAYPFDRIELFNLVGQPIRVLRPGADQSVKLNLRGLPAGIYVLRISTPAGIATRMITKKE